MTQYAGTDAFPSDVTVPDDTAPPTASNLLVSIEGALDRTIWLKNRTSDYRLVTEGVTATTDGNPVQIGSTPITFVNGFFSGDPTAMPLAVISGAEVGDVFEFELSGTVQGFGAFSDAIIKVIVTDGSVFDVPHSSVNWANLLQLIEFGSLRSDSGTYGTWTGSSWGTPVTLFTLSSVLAGDIVEIHANVRADTSRTGGTSSIPYYRLETTETGGSSTAEVGSTWFGISDILAGETQLAHMSALHTVAANGSLVVSLNGQITTVGSPSAISLVAENGVSVIASAHRPGLRISPFAIVGRYTLTSAGTFKAGLDGELFAPGSGIHLDVVGAMACKWRLMRSNA